MGFLIILMFRDIHMEKQVLRQGCICGTEAFVKDSAQVGNSAIIACGRGGQWEVALCLLSTMLSRLCAVDLYTGYSTVWACETAGEWEVALKVLKLIPETRVWGPRTLQFFFVSHVSCE